MRADGMRRAVAAGALLAAAPAAAMPATVVAIDTSAGMIRAELDWRAPATVANFLRYVRGGYFDRGRFFRTVTRGGARPGAVPIDVIQAEARDGEELDAFGPVRLERTSATGLTHRAGALSMARSTPDSATSSFSIVAVDSPELDAGGRRQPDGQGFAVFGRVIDGMPVVERIHRSPAGDERLAEPVLIRSIRVEPAAPAARRR